MVRETMETIKLWKRFAVVLMAGFTPSFLTIKTGSHLCYVSLVWAQSTNSVKWPQLLQKKFLRMFFQNNSHTGSLLKVSKILKSYILNS